MRDEDCFFQVGLVRDNVETLRSLVDDLDREGVDEEEVKRTVHIVKRILVTIRDTTCCLPYDEALSIEGEELLAAFRARAASREEGGTHVQLVDLVVEVLETLCNRMCVARGLERPHVTTTGKNWFGT